MEELGNTGDYGRNDYGRNERDHAHDRSVKAFEAELGRSMATLPLRYAARVGISQPAGL